MRLITRLICAYWHTWQLMFRCLSTAVSTCVDLVFRLYHLRMEEDLTCGELTIDSMVRGHHVYQQVWTPLTGENLMCARIEDNTQDRYVVAVLQHDTIVGHLPRCISTVCSLFIRRSGSIRCVVSDHRRYSRDLPQGGMEVPCKLHFLGNKSELKKFKSYFDKVKAFTVETTTKPDQSTKTEENHIKINDPAYAVVKAEPILLKDCPCSDHDILPIPEQGDYLHVQLAVSDDGCLVNELLVQDV